MRRWITRAALVGPVALALSAAPPPAGAATATVGTSDESWYQVSGCASVPCDVTEVLPVSPDALPAPLPTPSVDPFAAGTLHVGVLAGQERARSYIKLDLAMLPFAAELQGGVLTLPLATEPAAGTVRAETARIRACFMVSEFHGGDAGAVAAPPAPDCATSAPAHLVTLPGEQAFTVDLARFAQRWNGGEPNNGLALMTMDAPAPTETWEVAISGKGSSGAQIEAQLTYVLPAQPLLFLPPPFVFAPAPVFVPPAPLPIRSPIVLPPAPRPAAQPVAVTTRGFEYAALFLLPLVALALAGLLGYSLTREVPAPEE